MFGVESRWSFEKYMMVIKITAIAKISGIETIDSEISGHLLGKMVEVIDEAEKFGGKALDTVPKIPVSSNSIAVSSSIIFNSQQKLEEFAQICPQIFKQG